MISLLWSAAPPRQRLTPNAWEEDLGLPMLVRAITGSHRHAAQVRAVLAGLCSDPATIVYRQEVLADLLRLPALVTRLEGLLPQLAGLAQGTGRWAEESGVFQVAARLAELDLYVGAVQQLLAILEEQRADLRAAGWLELHAALHTLSAGAEFRSLVAELPALRTQIERAGSVTIGINLDARLHPESATLLGVSPGRFGGPRTLLGRLLGGERETQSGVTPLRQAGERQAFGPDRQLFQDLNHLLEEVTAPVAAALARYTRLNGSGLAALEGELAFYLGAARLIVALQREGYALCRPEIAPPVERTCHVAAAYSLELALRLREQPPAADSPAIVPNDIAFDDEGRIFVLTGPNRGGKTTYTRAVGLIQALAQAGLHVPGSAARLSPVDAIFTLFPAAEHAQTGMGRLDEEAARLAAIFRSATPHSLVLLNEPLGSTSPAEALGIARDVLGGLRMLGARALLVTHLHDLARVALTLNTAVDGVSRVGSLVAGVTNGVADQAARTYRITAGAPAAQSYAADIALQHGLHLSQIARTLQERGLS